MYLYGARASICVGSISLDFRRWCTVDVVCLLSRIEERRKAQGIRGLRRRAWCSRREWFLARGTLAQAGFPMRCAGALAIRVVVRVRGGTQTRFSRKEDGAQGSNSKGIARIGDLF
ncbi:hypothetical protein U1Q18_020197 [Sarracenia purpurea var. burkii]